MKLNWYLKRNHHDYYSLVEPYRKDGKNQHNKLYYFGRLNDDELKRINYALDILKNCKIEKPKLEDILFNDHWRFLDVAFLDFIWEQWGISKIFNRIEDKKVQTSEIAKILTISLLRPWKLSFCSRMVQQNCVRPYIAHKYRTDK